MRVHVVDPSAFTPPYDHALCAALARSGAEVELVTSPFTYGSAPAPDGYGRRERFYRRLPGAPGSTLRRTAKAAVHVPEMVAYARTAGRRADLVHFQWLDLPWLDRWLLPATPTVLTAHDLLPREPRPGQTRSQRRLLEAVDAVITHSSYGRNQLVDALGLSPDRVHVIPHGAFTYLTELPPAPLPHGLADPGVPVILFFGLLRPYKGLDTLLAAWRGVTGAELWIVGRSRMALEPLRQAASPNVRFVPEFVPDDALAACFRRADVVVLPYKRTERFDQSGVLATALAFGKAIVLTDIGGFGEVAATGAARLVPPGDAGALHEALAGLVSDDGARARLAEGARRAAAGPYSWDTAATRTLALYRALVGNSRLGPETPHGGA